MSEHGTRPRYARGCRCESCTRAASRYAKAWRVRTRTVSGPAVEPIRVPVGPVVEHLRALLASGWGYRELAREAGIASSRMSRMLRGHQAGTHRDVAARILALEPLTPVDLDPVVVERLVADPTGWRSATKTERVEAARIGIARGYGYAWVETLGLNWRRIRDLMQEAS